MQFGQLNRRKFITAVGVAAGASPLAARAQQLDRMRLIGVLMGFAESDPAAQSWLAAFRDTLTKVGWKEGNNLRIEVRWGAADSRQDQDVSKRTGRSSTRRDLQSNHTGGA
jgi:putative tryptophan/tyrosine transport system substrate-binding protein